MARFLALDWDQNQIHLIAADVRGSTVKVTRALAWPELRIPNPVEADELGKHLRERMKAAGIAPAPLLACIGRDRLIVKELKFPSVPENEEPALVRFQAVKELTESGEDVIIDYVVVGGQPGGEQKAAAVVIRKEILDTWKTLAEAAGLKLQALTPRLVGAAACLRKVMGTTVVTPAPEPADGVICIVVMGERFAEISIMRGQGFLLARTAAVGPNLAGEIRRNLAVHAGQQAGAGVVSVYLAGKGSGELRERLAEQIEIPVHTFDPFAGSDSSDLPTGNRGAFAGAMGLLVGQGTGGLPINFVSPRQPKPPSNTNMQMLRLAAIAGVTLFVGLFVLGQFFLLPSLQRQIDERQQDKEKLDAALAQRKEAFKRIKGLDDWDNPVWADELYNLNALIPDVNALRITSIAAKPLPRNAKTKASAEITVTGKLLDRRDPRKPLNQLVSALSKDGYYSPSAPTVKDDTFTLVYLVERRSPEAYEKVAMKLVERGLLTKPAAKTEKDSKTEEKPGEDEEKDSKGAEDAGKIKQGDFKDRAGKGGKAPANND